LSQQSQGLWHQSVFEIAACCPESMIEQVSFGESHKVVGGHPCLGDWDVSNAPQMQWNDGNVWTLDVQLPEGSDIEFKVSHCCCLY